MSDPKARGRAAAQYAANPEAKKAYARAWCAANPARRRSQRQAFATANPGYFSADARSHPERNRPHRIKRRARQAALPATVTTEELAETLTYFHGCCAYCLCPLGTVHWDHMVAVVRGGGSTQANLVPACPSCNSHKGSGAIWNILR